MRSVQCVVAFAFFLDICVDVRLRFSGEPLGEARQLLALCKLLTDHAREQARSRMRMRRQVRMLAARLWRAGADQLRRSLPVLQPAAQHLCHGVRCQGPGRDQAKAARRVRPVVSMLLAGCCVPLSSVCCRYNRMNVLSDTLHFEPDG